ncbi:MAG: hypothetical protein JSR77_18525 [Planctomycetes bacterium]|nr:hypothetical protein [Planctomycetota bacterium]
MVSLTAITRKRRRLAGRGIGLPGDNQAILDVARRLRGVVDAPVLGGIAVYLHGYARSTTDLDLYTPDREAAAAELEQAGASWDARRREHLLDGVRIHTITPEDAGHQVQKTSVIDGVLVVSLKDLIAIKLICGLNNPGRTKDLGDVEELIAAIGLDKSFAAKLPTKLRAPYKKFVDAVRARERTLRDRPQF